MEIKNKTTNKICPYCNRQLFSTQGFAIHIKNKHNKLYYEYLLEFELNNKWPLCKCGCCNKVPLIAHNTKFGEFIHGHNGYFSFLHKHHTEKAKEQIALSQTGKILSKSHVNNISKGVTQCYLDGRFIHKCGEFYSKKNKKMFYFRSSWEEQFMEELENDDNVYRYDYEGFVINYEFDDKLKRYLPDFLIFYNDNTKELIEIGQKKYKNNDEKEIAKINAAKEFCTKKGWKFKLLTEDYFRKQQTNN